MPSFTQEQYVIAFNSMPQKVEEILFADFTAEAIKNITNRHNVTNNAFDISASVGYVLVGLLPVKNFIKALQEDAELDAETAKNVAHDIREQIFAPVAQELAEMQTEANRLSQMANGPSPELGVNKSPGMSDESVIREHIEEQMAKSKEQAPTTDYGLPTTDGGLQIQEKEMARGKEKKEIRPPKPPAIPEPPPQKNSAPEDGGQAEQAPSAPQQARGKLGSGQATPHKEVPESHTVNLRDSRF